MCTASHRRTTRNAVEQFSEAVRPEGQSTQQRHVLWEPVSEQVARPSLRLDEESEEEQWSTLFECLERLEPEVWPRLRVQRLRCEEQPELREEDDELQTVTS